MSHFSMIVLVPKNTKDIKTFVENAMAPYSECLKVKEYETSCHCVGRGATEAISKQADKTFGTYNQMRDQFGLDNKDLVAKSEELHMARFNYKLPKEERKKKGEEYWELDEILDKKWKTTLNPRLAFEEAAFKKHKDRKKPDPKCGFYSEEFLASMRKEHPNDKKYERVKPGDRYEDGSGCGGTGKRLTCANPEGKWDWFGYGGRWTGDLTPDYDPEKDPRNRKPCFTCGGSGFRTDPIGEDQRKKDPDFKCNGCEGEGTRFDPPHEFGHYKGDILPTKSVPKDYAPFAIVTPDGEWHEHGKMGWFAIVSDEDDGWKEKATAIINDFRKDTISVLLDCHT